MKKRARISKKRQIALLAFFLALALLAAVCLTSFSLLGRSLLSQQAAERFAGESGERFAQVSVFFPVGKGIGEADIFSFRQTLDRKLTEASIEAPENGSLWCDAYSAAGELTVKGPRGGGKVSVLGVGGDYFLFHPLRLLSGGYISGDDLMHDRVVLDEETAWKLFGGSDVAGLEISIDEKPYFVAGVVARETDFADKKAYTGGTGIFMAYDTFFALGGSPVSCYELVCINPISGFALGIVAEQFAEAVTVENSRRFTVESIFKVVGEFGERSMNTAGVVFPYWENAARLVEDYMSLLLVLALLFGLPPAAFATVLLIAGLRLALRRMKAALPSIRDRLEERAWERREARRRKRKTKGTVAADGRAESSRH